MWPYLALIVVLGALLLFSQRNRKRQAAQQMLLVSQIDVGSEVMTTSGLYGTVVARHDDGTAKLEIAPGVQVRWSLAALRLADSLPEQYRAGLGAGPAAASPATGSVDGSFGPTVGGQPVVDPTSGPHPGSGPVDLSKPDSGNGAVDQRFGRPDQPSAGAAG